MGSVAQDGIFITQVELHAWATMLNTSIMSFVPDGIRPRWIEVSPIPFILDAMDSPLPLSNCKIYLRNLNVHFEPVLSITQ